MAVTAVWSLAQSGLGEPAAIPLVSPKEIDDARDGGSIPTNEVGRLKIAEIGRGNDYYDGGDGIDTIQFTGTTKGIAVQLQLGKAQGTEIGNDILVNIENVVAGSGDDFIEGTDTDNVLRAGDGDDSVIGLEGNDTLIGGKGNDKYEYTRGHGHDTLVEGDEEGEADYLYLKDVMASEIAFGALGQNLLVEIVDTSAGDGGSILITEYLGTSGQAGVEYIVDSEGRSFSKTDVSRYLQ